MPGEVNLQALEQGFRQSSTSAVQAQLITAVATAQPTTELIQVATPQPIANISSNMLGDNDDSVYQATFKNDTGATQYLVIGGTFSLPGLYQYVGTAPSAVDFLTFAEPSFAYPGNAGSWKSLAYRATQMAQIVARVETQSNLPAQGNLNMIVGKIDRNNDTKESKIFPSLCDACYNTNVAVTTKEYKGGPWYVGKNSYIKIPVISTPGVSDFVTVRLEFGGEASAAQFTAG